MMNIVKICANPVVDYAAEELKKYLRMMMPDSGDIGISYDPMAQDGFRLGLMENFGLDTSEALDLKLDDVLYIDTDEFGGIIAGSNPRSVLLAVYRYLRENGCRWLYPGIDGEYIPIQDVQPVKYHKKADHRFRGMCNEGAESQQCMMETIEFCPKIGMNVYMLEFDIPFFYYHQYYTHNQNKNRLPEPITHEQVKQWKRLCEVEIAKRGMQFHDMGHGWTADPFGFDSSDGWETSTQDITDEMRECLALIDGERTFWHGVPLNTNVCMSNPKVRTRMATAVADYAEKHQNVDILHVWLADGSKNHCECEECKKARPADHYIKIMNELDQILTARKLDTRIAFISYVDTLWAPLVERIKNPDRFVLLFAPITRVYTESSNKDTPKIQAPEFVYNGWDVPKSMAATNALLREWKKAWPGAVFDYEYHFWLHQYFDPGAMYFSRRIYDDIRGLKDLQVDGYVEDGSQRSFFPNGLNLAVYAEALFDSNASYEDILADYMRHAYGADWEQVAEHLSAISEIFDFACMSQGYAEDCVDEETGNRLARLAEVLKKGKELIGKNLSMPVRVQTVSYRLLWRHLEYCEKLGEIIVAKTQKETEKAFALGEAFTESFGKYEYEIERYYDHYLAMVSCSRLWK